MHNGWDQLGECPISERSFAEAVLRKSQADGFGSWVRPAPESRQSNQGEAWRIPKVLPVQRAYERC